MPQHARPRVDIVATIDSCRAEDWGRGRCPGWSGSFVVRVTVPDQRDGKEAWHERLAEEDRRYHVVRRGPGSLEGLLPGGLRAEADARGRNQRGVPAGGHVPVPDQVLPRARADRARGGGKAW